jgi:hypothetical protein
MGDEVTGPVHAPSRWAENELRWVGVAEEIVVGNLPAVRSGEGEHQNVAHAEPLDPDATSEHVTGRAQLTDHVYAHRAHLWAAERIAPLLDTQHRERVAVPPGSRQPEMMGSTA